MIILLVLLAAAWILAVTWSVLEIYSITANWFHEKAQGHGRFRDAD